LRRRWKRRAFIRLPQIFMSHQHREWFLLMSRNSQRQAALLHWWIRAVSSEVSNPAAARAMSQTGR